MVNTGYNQAIFLFLAPITSAIIMLSSRDFKNECIKKECSIGKCPTRINSGF